MTTSTSSSSPDSPTQARRTRAHRSHRLSLIASSVCLSVLAAGCTANAQKPLHFVCGNAKTGATPLSAKSLYTTAAATQQESASGFDLGMVPTSFAGGACSSDRPFFFSAQLPEGNYRVSVTLGGPAPSTTTVRAESRRLFVLERQVPAGKSDTQEFLVNLRQPGIAAGPASSAPNASAPGPLPQVKLKPREIGALDWDDKLTLEFNGEHPAVRSITITPDPSVPTLYLAGDSTVVDQDKEPWAAWGQMLPLFFGPGIAIANNAESGETIRSFVGERRLDKVMSTIKQGDFLMIQFAHNDQKTGNGYVPAATDYKDFLRRYIKETRAHGATPILVTSMNRRSFDASGHIVQTLGDYPAAMREVAQEQHVALIDLNALSKTLFEAMGDEGTLHAFVHYPANTFPDQPEELKDNTHFNAYGAYELAQCVVLDLRRQQLPLAPYLRKGVSPFDPAHPDSLASWHVPPSPFLSAQTPYGR